MSLLHRLIYLLSVRYIYIFLQHQYYIDSSTILYHPYNLRHNDGKDTYIRQEQVYRNLAELTRVLRNSDY